MLHILVLASVITVPTGADPIANGVAFQSALNSAQCGDTVVLQAGATYDGTFFLANKNCTSATPVTIASSAASSLPNGRVNPAHSANMPRVRTLGGGSYGAAFQAAPGAGWWILDGLEITDNGPHSTLVHMLVDLSQSPSIHDITIQRSYVHNKESGTDYSGSIRWAVQFEGSGLTLKSNYVHLRGYYYPEIGFGDYYPLDTELLLSVGGNTISIQDNYVNTWYSGIFLGGGDTAPQNTAILSSSSMSSAVFSQTTGLSTGLIIRLDFPGTATASVTGTSVTLTRTSGAVLSSADVGRSARLTAATGETGVIQIDGVSGDVISATLIAGGAVPNGSACDFVLYETAIVTGVSGNTVNYAPFGHDALTQPPTIASWNYGNQGLVHDVTLRGNTFYIDPLFAQDVYTRRGSSPKGAFEIKNAKRMTVDGNYFLGYPGVLAWPSGNQNGTAPWITTSDLTITNNWIAPDGAALGGVAMIIAVGLSHTTTPTTNVQIRNNFATNIKNLLQGGGGDDWVVSHNTLVNQGANPNSGYNSIIANHNGVNTNFAFKDNIASYRIYGIQCFLEPYTLGTCFPGGTFASNVVVDEYGVGVSTGQWGAGSILSPVPTAFSQVGFVDSTSGNYRLASSSPYKGQATDGTDPGVDMDALLLALNGGSGTTQDTTPPTVSISWFRTNNTVYLAASASDNVGVTRVEFFVDSTLRATDTTAPYGTNFNLSGPPGSQHTVMARAFDAAGNMGQSATLVLVK